MLSPIRWWVFSMFNHLMFSHSMLGLLMFGHSMFGISTFSLLMFTRWIYCETLLIGETWFHFEFEHPRGANWWPPRQEANRWPTGPVGLCIGVKLHDLHRAPPKQLDRGSNQSLCCEEEEALQGEEWNRGRKCVITAGFFTSSARSLVKLPIVGIRDKERLAAPVAGCLGWLGRNWNLGHDGSCQLLN